MLCSIACECTLCAFIGSGLDEDKVDGFVGVVVVVVVVGPCLLALGGDHVFVRHLPVIDRAD